jgi:hypothetical protein
MAMTSLLDFGPAQCTVKWIADDYDNANALN